MSQGPEFVGIEEPGETAAQYLGAAGSTAGAFALASLGPFGILLGIIGGLFLGTVGGRKIILLARKLF